MCWVLLALQKKTKLNVGQNTIFFFFLKKIIADCLAFICSQLHRFIGLAAISSAHFKVIEIEYRSLSDVVCILSTNGVDDICLADEPIVSRCAVYLLLCIPFACVIGFVQTFCMHKLL